MSPRSRHHGVRKLCDCGVRQWPKCPHNWYFNFKPKGGPHYRFCLDGEIGRHVESKSEAENESTRIRAAILAGTFERAVDKRAREQREAEARREAVFTGAAFAGLAVTLEQFAPIYLERVAKANGKASWKDDAYLLATVRDHRTSDGRRLGEWPLGLITEDELEAFHAAQRAAGRAASTLNHLVQ